MIEQRAALADCHLWAERGQPERATTQGLGGQEHRNEWYQMGSERVAEVFLVPMACTSTKRVLPAGRHPVAPTTALRSPARRVTGSMLAWPIWTAHTSNGLSGTVSTSTAQGWTACTSTAIGVVSGRAELDVAPIDSQLREGETGKRLAPREGGAAPGEYVTGAQDSARGGGDPCQEFAYSRHRPGRAG